MAIKIRILQDPDDGMWEIVIDGLVFRKFKYNRKILLCSELNIKNHTKFLKNICKKYNAILIESLSDSVDLKFHNKEDAQNCADNEIYPIILMKGMSEK